MTRERLTLSVHPRLSLSFSRRTGALVEMRRDGGNLLASDETPTLFFLLLRAPDGEARLLSSADFPSPNIAVDGAAVVFRYAGVRHTDLPPLSVTVETRLDPDAPESRWRTEVSGGAAAWRPEWIEMPVVRIPHALEEDEDGQGRVFLPLVEGCEIATARRRHERNFFRGQSVTFPTSGVHGNYPGNAQLPFLAYYRPDAETAGTGAGVGGLYFGAHDPAHAPKAVECFYEPPALRLAIQACVASDDPGRFVTEYDTVLAALDGDWEAAAEHYRAWMEREDPTLPAKLSERRGEMPWLEDGAVVMLHPVRGRGDDKGEMTDGNEYFPYVNALPVVEDYARRLETPILSVLKHWEGTAPWAPPYVWPPFGGEEALAAYRDGLHAARHYLGVYCSGTAWTQRSRILPDYSREEQCEREGLLRYMCRSPEGKPEAKICNGPGGQRDGYDACLSQEWTRETALAEIMKLADAGIDYAQFFDQHMGCAASACYASDHGHPPVPGPWMTRAMAGLLDEAAGQLRARGRKMVLGCEAAAAPPYLKVCQFNDNRSGNNFLYGRAVPAYAHVFHEYVNNFLGNGCIVNSAWGTTENPHSVLLRTAYAFAAGDALSFLLRDGGQMHWNWPAPWTMPPPNQEHLVTLLRRLSWWRKGPAKEWLVYGRRQAALRLRDAGEYVVTTKDGRRLVFDAVLTSRWTAPDGRSAQVMVNYLPEERRVTLPLPSGRRGRLQFQPDLGRVDQPFGAAGETSLSISLPPLSAVFARFDAGDRSA